MRISIIGAGPAGCFAGYLLAKDGHAVTIYDRKRRIGEPVQCTGIVTRSIYNVLSIPDRLVINRPKYVCLGYKGLNDVRIRTDDLVVDRREFDRYFYDLAVKAGARFYFQTNIIRVGKSAIFSREKSFDYDLLVGADGPKSIVSKYLNPRSVKGYIYGSQARVSGDFQDEYRIILGLSDYFGWVVPESKRVARVGVISGTNPNSILKEMISGYTPIDYQGGLIPVFDGCLKLCDSTRFLIGDAATFVKATTGGGLVQALTSAKVLALCINTKKNYQREIRRKLFRELNTSLRIRKVLSKFKKKDYLDLLKKVGDPKIRKILHSTTRDSPFRLITRILLKKPSIVKFIRYI